MKTARQLIEEKVKELGPYRLDSLQEKHKYVCADTGLVFETTGSAAVASPFTGSKNIKEVEMMTMTDVPANQKDPQKQVPLSPNPAPSVAVDWKTDNKPNPAPDDKGVVGATTADKDGFIPYPQRTA